MNIQRRKARLVLGQRCGPRLDLDGSAGARTVLQRHHSAGETGVRPVDSAHQIEVRVACWHGRFVAGDVHQRIGTIGKAGQAIEETDQMKLGLGLCIGPSRQQDADRVTDARSKEVGHGAAQQDGGWVVSEEIKGARCRSRREVPVDQWRDLGETGGVDGRKAGEFFGAATAQHDVVDAVHDWGDRVDTVHREPGRVDGAKGRVARRLGRDTKVGADHIAGIGSFGSVVGGGQQRKACAEGDDEGDDNDPIGDGPGSTADTQAVQGAQRPAEAGRSVGASGAQEPAETARRKQDTGNPRGNRQHKQSEGQLGRPPGVHRSGRPVERRGLDRHRSSHPEENQADHIKMEPPPHGRLRGQPGRVRIHPTIDGPAPHEVERSPSGQ